LDLGLDKRNLLKTTIRNLLKEQLERIVSRLDGRPENQAQEKSEIRMLNKYVLAGQLGRANHLFNVPSNHCILVQIAQN
jgi:hypothetical protein